MPPEVTEGFVELLEQADQPAAVRLVTGLAEQGVAPEELVLEVLVPAQREVGRRWERGDWSVAQEHAATGVTDTALGLLALDAEPSGTGQRAVWPAWRANGTFSLPAWRPRSCACGAGRSPSSAPQSPPTTWAGTCATSVPMSWG